MTATRQDITGWLQKLYANDDYTHMIVACDTYDHDNFPVYVTKDEDVKEREKELRSHDMQMVDEVYSKNHTLEEQMAEHRAFHYD